MAKALTTDESRFNLINNTYDQNYPGFYASIVNLQGVRNVYMSNETYQNNEFMYNEAIDAYGQIAKNSYSYSTYGFDFGFYYYEDGNGIDSAYSQDSHMQYTPQSPILIQGGTYVNIESIMFDNNHMFEVSSIYQQSYNQAGAILIKALFGEVDISDITIQNYLSFDATKINTLLGSA